MTETTEGLTRRMSSGSESSARALAAKRTSRAGSASQRGSLRFNIFRTFFSRKIGRARNFSAHQVREAFKRQKPNANICVVRRRECRRRRLSDYDLIFREVNRFVTELCLPVRRLRFSRENVRAKAGTKKIRGRPREREAAPLERPERRAMRRSGLFVSLKSVRRYGFMYPVTT